MFCLVLVDLAGHGQVPGLAGLDLALEHGPTREVDWGGFYPPQSTSVNRKSCGFVAADDHEGGPDIGVAPLWVVDHF